MATTSELDNLVDSQPIRAGRPIAWAVMLMLTAAIVWTYFTELVEVSVAQGEVVPQGQVRSVQHLEGGVVLEIFVLEGDLVEAGQPLVQVELSASELNPDEVQATLDAFILARARLIAESRDEAPVWPQDVVVRQPGIAQAEVLTYESRRAEIETSISVLRQQSEQRYDNSSSAVRSRTQGGSHDSVFPTAGHRRRSVLIRSRQCGGPPGDAYRAYEARVRRWL